MGEWQECAVTVPVVPLPCQRVRKWHGAERGEMKGGGRVREPNRRGGWRTGGGLERKRIF